MKPKLFKPSEELIKKLFKYHKARKTIKRKRLSKKKVEETQQRIGFTIRLALVTFGFRKVFITSTNKYTVDIVDKSGSDFLNGFGEMLRTRLGIDSDDEGDTIIQDLVKEFRAWLLGLDKSMLLAESGRWPYRKIYVNNADGVTMELNRELDSNN